MAFEHRQNHADLHAAISNEFLFNSKRRTYCRRRKGEALRDDTVQGTVKHGGASAKFWGCFGGLKVGDLFQVKGIMKKEEYHSILSESRGSRITPSVH